VAQLAAPRSFENFLGPLFIFYEGLNGELLGILSLPSDGIDTLVFAPSGEGALRTAVTGVFNVRLEIELKFHKDTDFNLTSTR